MPAIVMHAGAGVLLIIMTNFAWPKPNNKEQNHTSQITHHETKSNKPPPSYPHPKYQHHKISSQNQCITTSAPLHTTNLQLRSSSIK